MWKWGVRLPLGLVSDNVWILEGMELDLRRRGKAKILAVFIERWTSEFVPMYMHKGKLHNWMKGSTLQEHGLHSSTYTVQ